MNKFLKYSMEFYKGLKYALKDMIILPGKNLTDSLKISVLFTVVVIVSTLLGLPTLLRWEGCVLAVILLSFIVIIGGRNPLNEVLRRDGHVDVSTEETEDRATGPVDAK